MSAYRMDLLEVLVSAFYGILHTQRMNTSTIKAALSNAKINNNQSIEILGHPSNINDKRDKNYATN